MQPWQNSDIALYLQELLPCYREIMPLFAMVRSLIQMDVY